MNIENLVFWRKIYLSFGVPESTLPTEVQLRSIAEKSMRCCVPILVPKGLADGTYANLAEEVHEHIARTSIVLGDVPRAWFDYGGDSSVLWTVSESFWNNQKDILDRFPSSEPLPLFASIINLLDTIKHASSEAQAHPFWSRTCSRQLRVLVPQAGRGAAAHIVSTYTEDAVTKQKRFGRFELSTREFRGDYLAPFYLQSLQSGDSI